MLTRPSLKVQNVLELSGTTKTEIQSQRISIPVLHETKSVSEEKCHEMRAPPTQADVRIVQSEVLNGPVTSTIAGGKS